MLDKIDREALDFVALPPKAGHRGQESQDKNCFQRHQLVDSAGQMPQGLTGVKQGECPLQIVRSWLKTISRLARAQYSA